MRKKKISEIIDSIDSKYVTEASSPNEETKRSRRPIWLTWGAAAACLALVAVLGIGIFKSGMFDRNSHVATLENGDSITFVKTDSSIGQVDIAYVTETRDITESEISDMFGTLPVIGYALFNAEDGSILGVEGNIGDIKLTISVPGVMLNDTVIVGSEKTSEVGGVLVNAGYFSNKTKEIYYAAFKLGDNLFYVEHAGSKSESETTMNEISAMIQSLIENGEVDLGQLKN